MFRILLLVVTQLHLRTHIWTPNGISAAFQHEYLQTPYQDMASCYLA